MKALSIRQPWAELIVHGLLRKRTQDRVHKDIENRTWRSAHRGPLLIHAAQQWAPGVTECLRRDDPVFCCYLREERGEWMFVSLSSNDLQFMPRGGIVGRVDMLDCRPGRARAPGHGTGHLGTVLRRRPTALPARAAHDRRCRVPGDHGPACRPGRAGGIGCANPSPRGGMREAHGP